MNREQEEKGLGWYESIEELDDGGGRFFCPVLMWSYGFRKGIKNGRIEVWSLRGTFNFRDNRGFILTNEEREGHPIIEDNRVMEFFPNELEKLIRILTNVYGWGKPPHFKEVTQDVIKMGEALNKIFNTRKFNDKERVKEICADLKNKWKLLIS